ncbi:hypothetical protein CC80DRAFT_506924 [Byssothecium circinans]|uniref:RING-type domain-containing protein n=1 Tax=Byssothecium circinans TaxID=147558 RepID=A0A6A5TMU7_9PLEO|nr:hypothetical protein CC80DRAFT_506924 [Byssothecium circinans]
MANDVTRESAVLWPRKDRREQFDGYMRKLYTLYTEAMRSRPNHKRTRFSIEELGSLDWSRFLVLRQKHYTTMADLCEVKHSFGAVKEFDQAMYIGSEFCVEARIRAGSRVLWVENRLASGREVDYSWQDNPHLNIPKVQDVVIYKCDLERRLSEDTNWIVDDSIVLSLEFQVMITYVHNIEVKMKRAQELFDLAARLEDRRQSKIEKLVQPFTHERSSRKPEYSLCWREFGFVDDESTHKAVTTQCKHIFGKPCLQDWLTSHKRTCPTCVQFLWTCADAPPLDPAEPLEDILPLHFGICYNRFKHNLSSFRIDYMKIDKFLMEPQKDFYGDEMLYLIQKLAMIDHNCRSLIDFMTDSLEGMGYHRYLKNDKEDEEVLRAADVEHASD